MSIGYCKASQKSLDSLLNLLGMMTGQILGGSPVTEAAHYQILIMYLIATSTFLTIFFNVVVLYRTAFEKGTHVLRTDRFIEVSKKKPKKNQRIGIIESLTKGLKDCCNVGVVCIKSILCCCGLWERKPGVLIDSVPNDFEAQPLKYGSSTAPNRIQILTRRLTNDGLDTTTRYFHISRLQFSVPKSHKKKGRNNYDITDTPPSSMPQSPASHGSFGSLHRRTHNHQHSQSQEQRVLCSNLNASLNRGEIGIVRGPSG